MPTAPPPAPDPAGRGKPTNDDLHRIFAHRYPTGSQTRRLEALRKDFFDLACIVRNETPLCPLQTRAINALDEALTLSIKAIIRFETGESPEDRKQRE